MAADIGSMLLRIRSSTHSIAVGVGAVWMVMVRVVGVVGVVLRHTKRESTRTKLSWNTASPRTGWE